MVVLFEDAVSVSVRPLVDSGTCHSHASLKQSHRSSCFKIACRYRMDLG